MYTRLRKLVRWSFAGDKDCIVHHRVCTVPNLITAVGFVGIAFYIYQFTALYHTELIPFTVFLIGITDFLDGAAARFLNQHSFLGKLIDPVRDKLLMLAVLGNLLYLDHTELWLLVPLWLVVVCEIFLILQYGWYFLRKIPMRVHWKGKMRFAIVWACLVWILTQVYWFELEYIPAALLIWIVAALSVHRLVMKTKVWITALRGSDKKDNTPTTS